MPDQNNFEEGKIGDFLFSAGKEVPAFPDRMKLPDMKDRIDLRIWPELPELCPQMKPEILRNEINNKVGIISDKLKKFTDCENEFLYLHQCYQALNLPGVPEGFLPLKNAFSTFETFSSSFFPSLRNNRDLRHRFRSALSTVYTLTYPDSIITVNKNSSWGKTTVWRHPEDLQEEWVRIGSDENNIYYASRTIFDEYDRIRKSGLWKYSGYDHATSSGALTGIAKEKALLARDEVIKRGGKVITGEMSDSDPRVFVNEDLTRISPYSDIYWFNEYPVNVDISKDAPSEDIAPEFGISLGKEVNWNYFKRLFCPSVNRLQLQQWVNKNKLHIPVYPYEVYECFHLAHEYSEYDDDEFDRGY